MSTAAPPTQATSVPQGAGSAPAPTAPHRAAQRDHASGPGNLGTFGVRQAIYHP